MSEPSAERLYVLEYQLEATEIRAECAEARVADLLAALESLLDLDERCGWFSTQADAARAAIKRATEA